MGQPEDVNRGLGERRGGMWGGGGGGEEMGTALGR